MQGIFQVRILEWVAISFSRRLPDPGMEPMSLVSPALVGILHHLGRFLKVMKVLQGGVAMKVSNTAINSVIDTLWVENGH